MRRPHARTRINSKPGDNMDPLKTQIRPVTRSTNLFSRNQKNSKSNCLFTIPIALTATVITLISCYYVFIHAAKPKLHSSFKYGVIIDGGSTGTRIHVFSFKSETNEFNFELGSMRVNPGLSAYAEDPGNAGDSLTELLDFGKGKIPAEFCDKTDIRLMATAGLRLLNVEVQEKILNSCRSMLRKSGFRFRDDWATVITGSDEGVYAWVVANYALGTLGGDPLQTTGIIELGGASAQVAFVSNEPLPSEFSRAIKFGNVTYHLYSHSFLHFGQDVAFESLRESLTSGDFNGATESLQKGIYTDPCSPKGYLRHIELGKRSPGSLAAKDKLSTLQARGNFSECRSAALALLQKGKEKCSYKSCYLGSTFMPRLQGKFLATENFFHTSKFFGLHQRASLSDLLMAGEQFCGEDWSKLRKKHQSLHDEDLLHYCFSSAYIVALLHDSLGIALDDERIGFANQVENIPLDWALGAFILQSTADLDVQHPSWIATIIGGFCFSCRGFKKKEREKKMSDHVVLYVDRLTKPESVQENGEGAVEPIRGAGESENEAGPSRLAEYAGDEEMGENEPLLQVGECRICQEEDSINNLETPCACSGSLKFAHRKCVQHWCNEKGDIICEICHQQYEPNYIAPTPPPRLEDTAIEIGGGWTISGNPLNLHDPRLLAIAEAERHFLEAEYDEYDSSNASGAAFCRSAALIFMALLLLRHALAIPDADGEDDVSTFFALFLLRAAGFLLPCYIMAWAINTLQRRRQRQEAAELAATQVAFVLQSGQRRGLQFTIASGSNHDATQPQEIV